MDERIDESKKTTPAGDNIIVPVEYEGKGLTEYQFSGKELFLTRTNACEENNFKYGYEHLLDTGTMTNDDTVFLNPEQKTPPVKYDNIKETGEKASVEKEMPENHEKDAIKKIALFIMQTLKLGKIDKPDRIKIEEHGEISIKISNENRKTRIRITAEDAKTARTIQRNIYNLREILSGNNFTIPLFEIIVARQHRKETTTGAD